MSNKLIFLRQFKQKNYQISLAIIKENIVNLTKEEKKLPKEKINSISENKFINNIQNNPQKINSKIENFYKRRISSIFYYKNFRKFTTYIDKYLNKKKYLDSNIIFKKNTYPKIANDSIAYFSIYIIKDYLNENKHNEIKKYIKILIAMISLNIFSVENFIYILGLFINITLEIININKKDFNLNKKFSINESLLKIIDDVIESIVEYPKEISKNFQLLDSIIVLFEKFISKCQKLNILLQNDIEWLKLLKIKMINPEKIYFSKNNDITTSECFNKLIYFLIDRYKSQIPKNFYYEIFRNSAIDLHYYLNAINFLGVLFDTEKNLKSKNKFRIKNGFCIVNNTPLILNNIKFTEKEFSLVFSFQISKIEKKNEGESVILLNLFDKNIKNIIRFIVDKNNILQIIINEKEWNTKIIINKNEFYLLCLSQEKEKKAKLYINSELIQNDEIQSFDLENCVLYEEKMNYPKFSDDIMGIEIGKNNFSGIIGETIIINKILSDESVKYLFASNEYYADLLYYCCNKVKNDLIKNSISFYMTNNESINHFMKLEYNCLLKIMTYKMNQFLTHKHYFSIQGCGNLSYSAKTHNDLLHFKMVYNNNELFIKENGIDYLIFMLHNISSHVYNVELFNLYLYKTLNILYKIIESNTDYFNLKEMQNSNYLLKLNEFFMFLIRILDRTENKNYNNVLILNENIKEILLNLLDYFQIYSLDFQRNLILSILLDNRLFKYKKYLVDLERVFNCLSKIFSQNIEQEYSMINDEILYKILSFDYIFEINNIKHKIYTNLLSSFLCFNKKNQNQIISQKHKKICEEMIGYIVSLQNDIKIYHYLKIIYINVNDCKEQFFDLKFFQYLLIKVEKVQNEHCKYCKYIQILCYLLKKEIFINIYEEDKDKYFKYEATGFMVMPSLNFIKCVFIEYFNMDNKSKFKFIKSKGDNYLKFFEEKQNDFFELVGNEKFIPRFNAFISYLAFLQKEYIESDDLKLYSILEKYFSFVFSFIDFVLRLKDYKQETNKNQNFIQKMNESEGLKNFINLYLKFQKNCAFEKINEYIKTTIDELDYPFYFNILVLKEKVTTKKNNISNNDIDEDKSFRTEIIKDIISELISRKENNFNNVLRQNIILFLILTYNNIFNGYIKINPELSRAIKSFVSFLSNKNFFYDRNLFEVTIYDKSIKKEKISNKKNSSNNIIAVNYSYNESITNNINNNINNNDDISKKTIKKVILEMVLDILIFLYLNQDNGIIQFIDNILRDKENSTVFYSSDIQYFNGKRDEKQSLFDEAKRSQIVKNCSFCIYFLVYFLCKQKEIDNLNSEIINNILEILFGNLINLFKKFQKNTFKISKRDLIDEKYVKIYNRIIKIISKNINDKNFNYKFLLNELSLCYSKLKKQKSGENNGSFLNNNILEFKDNNRQSYGDLEIFEQNNLDLQLFGLENNDNENEANNNDSFLLEKEKLLNNNEHKRSRSFTSKKIHKFRKKFNKLYDNEDNENINIDDYETKQNLNTSNNPNQINQNDLNLTIISDLNANQKNKNERFERNTITQLTIGSLNINNFTSENESNNNLLQDITNNSGEKFDIYEKLSQINIPCIFYDNIKAYSKNYEFIKLLFNPKEYLIWQNFAIIFKDFIFNNTKFKNISKSFATHFRNSNLEKCSPNDEKYYLNYPTKIKNYINKEYCRIFLKPYLNFFKEKFLKVTHPYINKNLLISKQYLEDNFSYIEFKRIIPYPTENEIIKNKIIYCEKFCNKGNIFGYMVINREFLLFINDPTKDLRESKNLETKMQFLYTFKEDIIVDENKYTLIYFKEIKEMFVRRICFNNVGFEIFLKDNRSHLFNFFNKEFFNLFIDTINSKLQNNQNSNKNNQNIITTSEENNDNQNKKTKHQINIDNPKSTIKFGDIKIKVITKSWKYFEKTDYTKKFVKGEMSSFNYILLLNKYSSRSYNDYNQYLIFPLLIYEINGENIKLRDLSKAICLNKNADNLGKYSLNRKLVQYHFNNHYSTGGYVLFYMIRLIPFTYSQIKFQSGKFDLSERMFTSFKNLLLVFSITEENRELLPEMAYNFEFYLNLNKNDFGYINCEHIQINNFNPNIKNTFVEFVIYYRQLLEGQEKLSKWIDNIFGYKQFNDSDKKPNTFPRYSYKEFNNFEKEKKSKKPKQKIYEDIKNSIGLLTLGITPAKIFKSAHPKNDKIINKENKENNNSNSSIDIKEINNNSNNLDKKENSILKNIKKFIKENSYEKYNLILFENNLIFKFNSKAEIYSLDVEDSKNKHLSLKFKKQIKIQPYRNLFCELTQEFYCFVRNADKTIQFITKKENYKYLWLCIPTAVQKYKFEKIKNPGEGEKYSNKIFMGDEDGFLHLLKIDYEKNNDKRDFQINSISIIKSIKAHLGYIKGIIYDKRLNIILSWCDDGIISINNAYSLTCLNIINIGKKNNIKEIKISKYNLIFVSCYNVKNGYYYIKCFTLNGIKVTKLKSNIKIINFFLGEKLNVAFSDGNVNCFNLYDLAKEDKENSFMTNYYSSKNKDNEKIDLYACHYIFIQKWKKLLIIYSDNEAEFQDVGNKLL